MAIVKFSNFRDVFRSGVHISEHIIFFLISQNILIKRKRGATHTTQDVYKGKPKGRKISEKENPGN
jgi:hypothetical protein